jgi:hypothetical protein
MATSKNMTPELLSSQGSLKGLHLVASGDAFHQGWLNMIEEATEEVDEGVYGIKDAKNMHNEFLQEEIPEGLSKNPETQLILTAEVEDSKRVHHLIILPSLDAAYQMRKKLKGNLDSDGRPRVRMNGAEIQELALENGCIIGPSHAFTPWTSIYKEYDSVHDCYSETPHFVELGLSADTDMADRIEELQEIPFLTNSDAHSPWPHRLGREFNEIDVKNLSFPSLAKAIDDKKITANYGFDSQSFPLDRGWTVGAQLTFPIFSGYSTKYQVEEARATLDVLKANEENLRQSIYLDVQQAYLNLQVAKDQISTTELTVRQADENLELANGRYAAGVGNPIEVTDALVAQANAKTAYIAALYNYKIAQASIEKAMGVR